MVSEISAVHGTGLLSPAECIGSGTSGAGLLTSHQHVTPGSALIVIGHCLLLEHDCL